MYIFIRIPGFFVLLSCAFLPLPLCGQNPDSISSNADRIKFEASISPGSFHIGDEFELVLQYTNLLDDTICFIPVRDFLPICDCRYDIPYGGGRIPSLMDNIQDGRRWTGWGYIETNPCLQIYMSGIYDFDDPVFKLNKKEDKKNPQTGILLPPNEIYKTTLKLKFNYKLPPDQYEYCIYNDHRYILDRGEELVPNRQIVWINDELLKTDKVEFQILD